MPDSVTTLRQALRPAQLATDAIKNPTPIAKRFVTYPWGTNGRSLLTPTREYNTTVPATGGQEVLEQMRGDQATDDGNGGSTAARTIPASTLVQEFSDMARAEGKTLDDLVDELERTLPDLTDDQKATARAMLNIRWVGDRIFEISDEVLGAPETNAINPLFQRDRWCNNDELGETAELPRCMYNVNGRRGEWNPRTDDWLWDRLQPLLRHLSRLWEYLTEHDPYWKALLNPFNRMKMTQSRGPRNEKSKTTYPLMTFTSRPDEHRSGRHPLTDRYGRHPLAAKLSAKIDGAAKTLDVLNSSVQFDITSVNHFVGYKPGTAVEATTCIKSPTFPHSRLPFIIKINLSANQMFPLLHDGYQASEKTMTIHCQSMVILHELAHAVNQAQYSLLRDPGPEIMMPRYKRRAVENLALYGRWLYGEQGWGHQHEPVFEDETELELGFSSENAIFGGISQGMMEWCASSLRWDNLAAMPSGLRLTPWPYNGCFETNRYELDDPDTLQTDPFLDDAREAINGFQMHVPWSNVAKLQTDEFWSVQVQKFGSAALRLAPDANTKVFNMYKVHHIPYLLTERGRDLSFSEVLHMPLPENSSLVERFLKMQVAELKRVRGLQRRWEAEIAPLTDRMRKTGAIHCLLHLYLQSAVWYDEWTSSRTRPVSLRWNSVYREYKKMMGTFSDIVGADRPDDDASAQPRWLPPVLTEKIKNADGLRDTLKELQQEGSGQLLPLTKQVVHIVNEVIVKAGSFLAELWTLLDVQRRELGDDFRCKIQVVFSSALGRCFEVMETARGVAEADVTSSGLLVQALATTTKLKWLRRVFKNLRVVPDNALDMLTCVPSLTKSQRLASDRWLRAVRSELLCLDSEGQQCAEDILEWLRTHEHPTAMQISKPDLANKSEEEGLDEWRQLMSDWERGGLGARPPGESLGDSKPGMAPAPSQEGDDNDRFENDVSGSSTRRRPGEVGHPSASLLAQRPEKSAGEEQAAGNRRAPTSGGSKKRDREEGEASPKTKRQKTVAGTGLTAGSWRAPKPAGRGASSSGWRTGGLKLLTPKQMGVGNPRLRHSSTFTDGTFSDRSTDSPFRGISPAPGQTGQPRQAAAAAAGASVSETAAAVQPMFGTSAVDVPATIGMFPHPYALNATTTADLALVPPAAARVLSDSQFQGPSFKKRQSRLPQTRHEKKRRPLPDAQELEPGPFYGLRLKFDLLDDEEYSDAFDDDVEG